MCSMKWDRFLKPASPKGLRMGCGPDFLVSVRRFYIIWNMYCNVVACAACKFINNLFAQGDPQLFVMDVNIG
jgi:hypothetical protein